MKKIIAFILALTMCLSLVACGEPPSEDNISPTKATVNCGNNTETIPPTEPVKSSEGLEFSPNSDGTCAVSGIGTCTDAEIVIPAEWEIFKVTSIYSEAFKGCSSLVSVVILEGVTSIGYSAFAGCSSLVNVMIPEGVTSIGENAFEDCVKLKSIIIPDSVNRIDEEAFKGCYLLDSVTTGRGLTWIENEAFADCYSLTEITLPIGVKSIGFEAFGDCTRLTSIHYGGTKEQWAAIQKGIFAKDDESDIGLKSCTIYCTDGEIKFEK